MRYALASLAHRPPDDDFVDTLRPGTCHGRLEVCPPRSARRKPWYAALGDWLRAGWAGTTPAPTARRRGATPAELERVRRDFSDAVDDLRTPAAGDLLDRIQDARGLRELWHLRAEVFRLVSLHHSQVEADERLAWLNRHFPTRSPRSGFGPLGGPHGAASSSKHMWP